MNGVGQANVKNHLAGNSAVVGPSSKPYSVLSMTDGNRNPNHQYTHHVNSNEDISRNFGAQTSPMQQHALISPGGAQSISTPTNPNELGQSYMVQSVNGPPYQQPPQYYVYPGVYKNNTPRAVIRAPFIPYPQPHNVYQQHQYPQIQSSLMTQQFWNHQQLCLQQQMTGFRQQVPQQQHQLHLQQQHQQQIYLQQQQQQTHAHQQQSQAQFQAHQQPQQQQQQSHPQQPQQQQSHPQPHQLTQPPLHQPQHFIQFTPSDTPPSHIYQHPQQQQILPAQQHEQQHQQISMVAPNPYLPAHAQIQATSNQIQSNFVMPEKVSKAIKIVNPKTKEEVDPKGPSRPSSTTLPLTETKATYKTYGDEKTTTNFTTPITTTSTTTTTTTNTFANTQPTTITVSSSIATTTATTNSSIAISSSANNNNIATINSNTVGTTSNTTITTLGKSPTTTTTLVQQASVEQQKSQHVEINISPTTSTSFNSVTTQQQLNLKVFNNKLSPFENNKNMITVDKKDEKKTETDDKRENDEGAKEREIMDENKIKEVKMKADDGKKEEDENSEMMTKEVNENDDIESDNDVQSDNDNAKSDNDYVQSDNDNVKSDNDNVKDDKNDGGGDANRCCANANRRAVIIDDMEDIENYKRFLDLQINVVKSEIKLQNDDFKSELKSKYDDVVVVDKCDDVVVDKCDDDNNNGGEESKRGDDTDEFKDVSEDKEEYKEIVNKEVQQQHDDDDDDDDDDNKFATPSSDLLSENEMETCNNNNTTPITNNSTPITTTLINKLSNKLSKNVENIGGNTSQGVVDVVASSPTTKTIGIINNTNDSETTIVVLDVTDTTNTTSTNDMKISSDSKNQIETTTASTTFSKDDNTTNNKTITTISDTQLYTTRNSSTKLSENTTFLPTMPTMSHTTPTTTSSTPTTTSHTPTALPPKTTIYPSKFIKTSFLVTPTPTTTTSHTSTLLTTTTTTSHISTLNTSTTTIPSTTKISSTTTPTIPPPLPSISIPPPISTTTTIPPPPPTTTIPPLFPKTTIPPPIPTSKKIPPPLSTTTKIPPPLSITTIPPPTTTIPPPATTIPPPATTIPPPATTIPPPTPTSTKIPPPLSTSTKIPLLLSPKPTIPPTLSTTTKIPPPTPTTTIPPPPTTTIPPPTTTIPPPSTTIPPPTTTIPPATPTTTTRNKRMCYTREFLLALKDLPICNKPVNIISTEANEILKRRDSMGSLFFATPPQQQQQQQMLRMMQQHKQQFDNMMFSNKSHPHHARPVKRLSQKREFSHQPQQLQQRVVINVQLNSEVQLHTTDQAWKPSKKGGAVGPVVEVDPCEDVGGGTIEEVETALLYKKTRSILNKLTPQNFETLLDQLKEMKITTEDRLTACIDLVFEKAISEPNFCEAYAKMAQNISTLKVPSKEKPTELLSFRKLLLNRCQEAFEIERTDELEMLKRQKEIDECHVEDKRKAMVAERDDKLYKARRRSLGNIRFIGELFRIKMLTDKIMFECWFKLMKADDVDSLECLCWLIRTIGKVLDIPSNKDKIDAHFHTIVLKATSEGVSLRTRFMLQDLLELRSNKWVPRRNDNNPKTIEQIHQEAHKEEQLRQASLTSSFPPPPQQPQQPHQRHNRHNFHRGSDPTTVGGDEWTICNRSGGFMNRHQLGKTPIDHSKLKFHKLAETDFKLEPNRVNWTAGSNNNSVPNFHNMASRNSSQESEKSSSSNNRFAALLNSGGDQFDQNSTTTNPPSTFNNRFTRNRDNHWRNQGGNSGGGGGAGAGFKPDLNFNSLPRRKGSKEGGVMVARHSPRPSPNHSSSRESSISRDRNSPHPRQLQQHLSQLQQSPQQLMHSQAPAQTPLHLQQQQQQHKSYHNYPHQQQQQFQKQQHSSYSQFKTSSSSPKSDMVFTRSIPPLPPTTSPSIDSGYHSNHPNNAVATSNTINHSFNNKISCLLEEYNSSRDIKETLMSVDELKLTADSQAGFIWCLIGYVVDKKTNHLVSCGLLIAQLYLHKVLHLPAVIAGLDQAVSEGHDLQIDVPRIWDNLSDLLTALLIHCPIDLLPVVFGISQSSKNSASKAALRLVVDTLLKASRKMGVDKYMRVWVQAGCSWWQVVAGSYANFVQQYKAESLKPLACDLLVQLSNNNNLRKWIKEYTETDSNFFINNLMTAICFAAIKIHSDGSHYLDTDEFNKHLGSLKEWMGGVGRQMVALDALQQLDHALEHPSSLLNSFFHSLHLNDVISDTCFLQWLKQAPRQHPGKGIAITSTSQFFSYLQENQET